MSAQRFQALVTLVSCTIQVYRYGYSKLQPTLAKMSFEEEGRSSVGVLRPEAQTLRPFHVSVGISTFSPLRVFPLLLFSSSTTRQHERTERRNVASMLTLPKPSSWEERRFVFATCCFDTRRQTHGCSGSTPRRYLKVPVFMPAFCLPHNVS